MRNWLSRFKTHDPKRPSGTCEKCASTSLKRTLATYPVPLTGKLTGKRIDVYRVQLDQCKTCGHLMPTPEGKAKVNRCVRKGKQFFLNNLS